MQPQRDGRATAVAIIVPVYASLIAVEAVRVSLLILLLPIAVAVLGGVLLLFHRRGPAWWQEARRRSEDGRWLPYAWLVFVFVSNQKFTARGLSGESAVSSAGYSVENLLELGWYAAIAMIMIVRWPVGRPKSALFPAALLAWPIWAAVSSLWSLQPVYTAVRSLELMIAIAFAVFTARRLDALAADGTAFFSSFFRLFVNVATIAAVSAFVFPQPWLTEGNRLTWYGVHPLVAAEILAVATLALLVGGRTFLRFGYVGWALRLGVVATALVRTQGRTSLVAFVLALLIVLYVAGRQRPLQRWLGIAYYVGLIVGGIVLFSDQLVKAALRGEGIDRLVSLDSRLPLWQYALEQLHAVPRLFFGFGLGTSRLLLADEIAFAGQAHNSVIEALLGAGLIGAVLLIVLLFVIARRLRGSALPRPLQRQVHAVLVGTYGLLLVLGIGSPELALPGFSWSLVCLILVAVLRTPLATLPGPRRVPSTREPSASTSARDAARAP